MSLTIQAETPPLTVLDNGTVRIAGTRVNLEFVIEDYLSGMTADQISERYRTLELADIHAVIGWFLHHRADVEAYMAEQEREGKEIEADVVRDQRSGADFKKMLLSRRTKKSGE